jgi:hypothetical protein
VYIEKTWPDDEERRENEGKDEIKSNGGRK